MRYNTYNFIAHTYTYIYYMSTFLKVPDAVSLIISYNYCKNGNLRPLFHEGLLCLYKVAYLFS